MQELWFDSRQDEQIFLFSRECRRGLGSKQISNQWTRMRTIMKDHKSRAEPRNNINYTYSYTYASSRAEKKITILIYTPKNS